MDNKILVSILTHRCQCPHGIPKTGGVRGGATHIHKRELSSEPHVKKGYKLRNHHFYNPGPGIKATIDKIFNNSKRCQIYNRKNRNPLK